MQAGRGSDTRDAVASCHAFAMFGRGRREEQRLQDATGWADLLHRTGRVEIRTSRRPPTKALLLCLVLGVFTALVALEGEVAGWVGLALLGLCAAIQVAQFRRAGRPLVIDHDGISYEPWRLAVAWRDVIDVVPASMPGLPLVNVVVRSAASDATAAGRPSVNEDGLEVAQGIAGTTMSLPANLAADTQALAGWLRAEAMRRRAPAAS